jgi:hypothetical protein
MFNQNYDSASVGPFFDFSFFVRSQIITVFRLLSKSCVTSNLSVKSEVPQNL